jgi:hypothetical protein
MNTTNFIKSSLLEIHNTTKELNPEYYIPVIRVIKNQKDLDIFSSA